ncbi:MAG: hypothetical protein MUC47_03370 [Candidatus Kapabacteria bacterium]|nr:hypothetical protein [Candidatus Kapabacteria bacterium]
MNTQHLQWVVVPSGIRKQDGKTILTAAIAVQPRLEDDTTAPDVLKNWKDVLNFPAFLAECKIGLLLNGNPIAAASVNRISTPSEKAWKALFDDSTPVKPYQMRNITDHRIFTYPVKNVSEALVSVFKTMAKEYPESLPDLPSMVAPQSSLSKQQQPPQVPKVLGLLQDLIPTDDDDKRLDSIKQQFESDARRVAEILQRPETPRIEKIEKGQLPVRTTNPEAMLFSPGGLGTPKASMLQADLYHSSRSIPLAMKGTDGKQYYRAKRPQMRRPELDFHQVLGATREYPAVMRRLGIVIDVEFAVDGLPDTGWIAAAITLPGATQTPTTQSMPRTAYHIKTDGAPDFWYFLPRPADGSDIKDGVLCLNDPALFGTLQFDVDASVLKTLNYLRGMRHWIGKTRNMKREKRTAEPPSFRGTGLSLTRYRRGVRFAAAAIRNVQNHNRTVSNDVVTLYADDLMRGFRVDVWDDVSNTWRSLMERQATYGFIKAPEESITAIREEGTMSLGASRPLDAAAAPIRDLYAHEVIAQWEGWSLVVPRIGRFIDTDDSLSADTPKASDSASPDATMRYKLSTDFAVPAGSLPRLRFGRTYRMRARVADVAGGGLGLLNIPADNVACASKLTRYLRWDPVISPAITLVAKPVEGESLERMVIRNYNDGAVGSEPATSETSTRQFFPPVASVELCERHGKLDSSPTGPMRSDLYAVLAAKTALKTSDLPYQWYKQVFTTQTASDGTKVRIGQLVELGGLNTDPASEADRAVGLRYPIVPASVTTAPYLPDPMARGVVFANVPGMPAGQSKQITLAGETSAAIAANGGVVTVTFDPDSAWPDVRSIMLTLAEGTQQPAWNAASRTLTVYLPKGEQAWITFGSTVGDTQAECNDVVKLHGLWDNYASAGLAPQRLESLARGLGWQITPGRTLHLVHATQRPLTAPVIDTAPTVARGFGDTSADLVFTGVDVHGRTTQKVDVVSSWLMDTDDPLKDAPEQSAEKAVVFEHHIEERTDTQFTRQHTQEFGDTKYRRVRYAPIATTRFREYLPSMLALDADKLTRQSEGIEVDVLNTKRPDMPSVLYAIPSFRWPDVEKTMVDGFVSSTRKGGGIRIYLDRPWYSSGNGELLGVILYTGKTFQAPANPPTEGNNGNKSKFSPLPKGVGKALSAIESSEMAGLGSALQTFGLAANSKVEIPETLTPYVTQWGLDPIWLSKPTPSDNSPRVQNFVEPAAVNLDVSLEELGPKHRFAVVGFKPEFDPVRKLWFCDIEIDPGESYYPFIRLALVRFQPKSLDDSATGNDVYVSRVVQSEFCQIAPDRQATARVEADGTSVTISVIGSTYRMNSAGHQGSEIEVTIEKREAGAAADADLAWTPIITRRIDRIHAATMWSGLIELGQPASANLRAVIKEYEVLPSDPEGKQRLTSLGSKEASTGDVELTIDKRIVYADILPLG